ncbi:hypothetical protein [Methylobacterium sp. WL120]|uniref:hypothetical protein n=1 Tax=Methylobacterium sp. WL120 TaxID=2603887 RepID=UPI0011C841BF|nr:hypothetical protein [Methylobacterium sp. WL120]TXM60424.1 hypothetical protein FV229_24220 [Methylobacterium sp. WL120]
MHTEPSQIRQDNEDLSRLAEALGGTVPTIFGASTVSREMAALSQLLRLWTLLPCDASRADAVEAVRCVAQTRGRGRALTSATAG